MKHLILALAPLLLSLIGCAADTYDVPRFDEAAWESELLEHRDKKNEEFRTSSSSPMAGTQYLKSEKTDRVWLRRDGKTFELADEPVPGACMALEKLDGAWWHWTANDEAVVCRMEGEEAACGSALVGPAAFTVGGSHLSFYPSEDRVTFIVFDPERAEKTAFEQLLYFPPDTRYAVDAELVRIPEPVKVEMLTSRNLLKTFYRYARVRFRLDGDDHELTAFKSALSGDGSMRLFIPFRDTTSGKESYGAGRFLELEEPEGERFVLDFNRSFNPLCNYSPAYNCTIPPRENHLDVAIRAGEKTYTH